MDEERRGRPGELGETPAEDVPQDPGVPGVTPSAAEPPPGEEPEDLERAAEVDRTLAPGSMPPPSERS